jgi:hypothetical protein
MEYDDEYGRTRRVGDTTSDFWEATLINQLTTSTLDSLPKHCLVLNTYTITRSWRAMSTALPVSYILSHPQLEYRVIWNDTTQPF